jgi:DNA-binding protein H-NS
MTITINHNHKFDYKPYFEKIDTRLYGIESNQARILLLLNKIRMEQEQLAQTLREFKALAIAKFEALQEQLATADDVKPELQAAADELGAALGVTTLEPEPTPEP